MQDLYKAAMYAQCKSLRRAEGFYSGLLSNKFSCFSYSLSCCIQCDSNWIYYTLMTHGIHFWTLTALSFPYYWHLKIKIYSHLCDKASDICFVTHLQGYLSSIVVCENLIHQNLVQVLIYSDFQNFHSINDVLMVGSQKLQSQKCWLWYYHIFLRKSGWKPPTKFRSQLAKQCFLRLCRLIYNTDSSGSQRKIASSAPHH